MTDFLTEKYRQTPHSPGVYLMKDRTGKTIYVGKANDLKKRLSAYFVKKNNHDPKTAALIETVKDFDIVITSSGHEAFILESNLIKKLNPRYNVILKDGKNYPLLRIDMSQDYPSIQRVRKIKKDGAVYFGPYSSSSSVNRTLRQIQKIFRLRRCRDTQFKNRSRPCLNFQIRACMGPCCNEISPEEYRKHVQDAVLFLGGKSKQVTARLKQKMAEHAEALEYEEAARIRDTIKAIENVMEKQVVASPDLVDRDIIAVAADRAKAVVTVMMVRSGFLIDTAHYPFDLGFRQGHEILAGFFEPYYRNTGFIPASILVNHKIDTREVLEHRLSEQKSRKVSIQTPVRGPKKKLVEMAVINASRELEKILEREEHDRAALVMLKQLMGMDRIASRIECFDNSNLSGQNPVSSMVVFTDGRPDKAQYRKFIIRDMEFQDDYAYMYQVLSRRFAKNPNQMPYPDLLVVDGGKGQLSVAMAVMRECGLEGRFAVAGIAKKDETKGEKFDKIYVPGRSNPLNTGPYLKALYLLQNVRDEAHRSVIGFQRKRREKIAGISILDNIPGIGPARKRTLLKHFKGISGILKADTKQIAALPGLNEKLAVQVKKVLGSDKS